MTTTPQLKRKEDSMVVLKWIGYLCYVFAVADFGLSWVGIDVTGVIWSPIVAILVGTLLVKLGGRGHEAD